MGISAIILKKLSYHCFHLNIFLSQYFCSVLESPELVICERSVHTQIET